jgi:uncharacterized membrane protein YfbV (UPF0208 family)
VAPDKHDVNVEACSRIFVTWAYAAALFVTVSLTIAGLAWAGSERLTKVDANIEVLRSDVTQLKTMDHKLDTLLVRTK